MLERVAKIEAWMKKLEEAQREEVKKRSILDTQIVEIRKEQGRLVDRVRELENKRGEGKHGTIPQVLRDFEQNIPKILATVERRVLEVEEGWRRWKGETKIWEELKSQATGDRKGEVKGEVKEEKGVGPEQKGGADRGGQSASRVREEKGRKRKGG